MPHQMQSPATGVHRKHLHRLVLCLVLAGGVSAPAQNLPLLSIQTASNQTFRVAWPYTNTGFTFQESNVVTNWQSSARTPAFDSNSASFSVTGSIANSTDFFRLKRPTDLRGIYIFVNLATPTNAPGAGVFEAALNVPGVDGMLLAGDWSAIETNLNQYNWSHLDQWIHYATGHVAKIDLAIQAGNGIPPWLFQPPPDGADATPLVFTVSPHGGASGQCIEETNTLIWDPAFLTNWSSMLSVLSNHLKTNGTYDKITLLRLTGINRTTDELRLPAETAASTGLMCVSNAPAIWASNGFTPTKLLSGWSNIVASFSASFPDKTFCAAIIPSNAFPQIDDNTNIIIAPNENEPLLQLAGQMLPGRFVVQFNFLLTTNPASPAVISSAQNYASLPAYQVNEWLGSTGGAACGGSVTNPTPCDDAAFLQMLETGIYPLGQTNPLRSQYIEVFATNAIAFTNAIWQAHQELLSYP
jgi:hypothetical protein